MELLGARRERIRTVAAMGGLSLLAACGMLPGATVDQEAMRRTLRAVMSKWNWGTCWAKT